jgi:hypothetical protein
VRILLILSDATYSAWCGDEKAQLCWVPPEVKRGKGGQEFLTEIWIYSIKSVEAYAAINAVFSSFVETRLHPHL